MAVVAMPTRNDERIERLCQGAINLAKLSERKRMPSELVAKLNSSFKTKNISEIESLPTILEYAGKVNKATTNKPRKELEEADFDAAKFLNCLIGGERSGFKKGEYLIEELKSSLRQETVKYFGKKDRSEAICEFAKLVVKKNINGMHVTFNHWTDLALEIWGDKIEQDKDFSVDLMIIGNDAYSVDKMKNALLHQYCDGNSSWQHLWEALLSKSEAEKIKYSALSNSNTYGQISLESQVGKKMRELKIWPTNAVPYLRGVGQGAVGALPAALKKDSLSIALLAYQIWLLNPKHILVLSKNATSVANVITKKAIEIPGVYLSKDKGKNNVTHPAFGQTISCDEFIKFKKSFAHLS